MNRSHLLTELRHFKPFDESESDSVAQTIALIENEPDAFQRHLKTGHVTGSALLVGFGGEKVLLMHHKGLDRWLQFGGHADGDENILRVAMRETAEESGIQNLTLLSDGIFDVDVHPIPERVSKNEAAHFHYDVRYLLYTEEKEFTLGDGGVMGLQWFDYEAAIANTTSVSARRMLDKWHALRTDRQPKLFTA